MLALLLEGEIIAERKAGKCAVQFMSDLLQIKFPGVLGVFTT